MSPSIPPSLRPALEAYAARLRAAFGDRLEEVRLFGSFARGEANDDSDVDVLVLIREMTDREMGIAVGEAASVIVETGLPLAPIAMSTARLELLRRQEGSFARALDEEGLSV